MKMQKTSGCNDCLELYNTYRCKYSCSVEGAEFAKHEIFVYFRTFDWAKHGLQKPTFSLFKLCSAIEQIVQMNMEATVNGNNGVMCKLLSMVTAAIDVQSYPLETVCSVHQTQRMNDAVRLYLRVRIHHFVRIRNRELKELELKKKEKCTKKNRKLEKITHN
jgi:hypothetical protein